MTKCAPVWRLLLLLSLAFSLLGCSQFKRSGVADEKDPHYMEGKRRESGMDWDGAIQSYERALQSNPNNAAAHLALGILYAERKNDFAAAIYHYQKHLNFDTNAPRAEQIMQQINACKRELAKTGSFAPLTRDMQREMERLTMTNVLYARRIEALDAELRRGPRYITNTVTNFVKVPDLEQKGGHGLTRSTTIVDAPEPQEAEETPRAAPPERPRNNPVQESQGSSGRQDSTRESSSRLVSTREKNTRENERSSERNAPMRSSGSTASRSPQTSGAGSVRTVHTVKPGQTLDVLARQYGVSIAALRAANPDLGRGTRAGQKVNIPNK